MNKSEKCSRGNVLVAAITRLLKLGTQAKSKRKRIPAIQPQTEKPAPCLQRVPALPTQLEKQASCLQRVPALPAQPEKTVTMTPPRVGDNLNRQQPNNQQTTTTNGQNMPAKRTPKDYIFGKVIGDGSFSTVYIAKDIHSNKEVAIKVCDKLHIIREKKAEYIKREKDALNIISSHRSTTAPFFTDLDCTFQDNNRLYFVLTYAKNGELLPHINKVGSFDIACTRFYAAEILHALEHMHSLGIIHRDLKPENILLDDKMHILITDFGSAKILQDSEPPRVENTAAPRLQRRNSFVGTAQYVSPELLTDKSASKSSDLWALGCIIYQMVSGLPPFRSRSEYAIFKKILRLEYEFPDGFSPSARDLVEKLLVLDPLQRLGARDPEGYPSIRAHPFFSGIDFSTLYKQTPPQIYPYLPGTSENEELRSQYRVPDHLEPGLDDRQLTRLLGLDLQDATEPEPVEPAEQRPRKRAGITDINSEELTQMLEAQRDSKWNTLVEGNLILKQGLVDKRKGLFARRRMLLLTLGPHLYYVDPVNMVLKGEIPWSPELRVEPKSFKIFFVHTPNRTYYLEDPDRYALEWCKAIEEVRIHTYGLSS